MKLGDLTLRCPEAVISGDPRVEVYGLTHDSRKVEPGWIFAALPGENTHGLAFLDSAIASGAAGVLSDQNNQSALSLPWISSSEPRHTMARLAWALAGEPQQSLRLIGITGTNGKTTTTDLIAAMFESAGHSIGCFGTLEYRIPGEAVRAERTTPEATDLAPLLGRLKQAGGDTAVLEVSSHAIDQHRVEGLEFSVAVFTNLSRDHLDYHGDMESYFEVKRRLFGDHLHRDGTRVIPADDPWGRRLLEEDSARTVSYGLTTGAVHARDLDAGLDGSHFRLVLPDGEFALHLPLVGAHNMRNALAAAATAFSCGLPPDAIVSALENAAPVTGRLEPVATQLTFPIFVDFAHTPDGLHSVLSSLRSITKRKLVVVFGAGGDRDQGKRGPMGEAVGRIADLIVVTSDNPRSEEPASIAEAVALGVRKAGSQPEIILDRRAAIAHALELADDSSLVVVAGKGHERDQLIAGNRIPFDDVETIRELAGGKV
ncbi:MAG: UDP-N-acetylmuramoyl-L-alanyl-D-glutamate--2,6-diaminopimelate ligase [bacterium]|nr:UDP-N-acetylmuramoyl-L-alanyl-D-glutamate--2,6-diaminopimelate ligase [bacterium]